jgi:hypothetical protein
MKITPRQIAYNITRHLKAATDDDIYQGENFYPLAHFAATETARNCRMSISCVADVTAILSPFNKWNDNQQQAAALCFAHAYNRDPDERAAAIAKIPFTTFPANVEKAVRRLQNNMNEKGTGPFISPLKAPKTYSFSENIQGRLRMVTVDRWILRAINYPSDTITHLEYTRICKVFQNYADTRTDYEPATLQAIVWSTVRNKHLRRFSK